jgi:uncharacterized protein (TIGR02145 family)
MIGVGLGVVAKRRYSGFPFALRSFWQRVRDAANSTMFSYNEVLALYRGIQNAGLDTDGIKLAWNSDGAAVVRTDGILKFYRTGFGIGLDLDGSETATAQPRLVGGIAPTSKVAASNQNGEARGFTVPTISFTTNESWSVSFMINIFGRDPAEVFQVIIGDSNANTGTTIMPFGTDGVWQFRNDSNQSASFYANVPSRAINNIGKNKLFTFTANGISIKMYYDDTLVETINIATNAEFNRIFNNSDMLRRFLGNLSFLLIQSGELTAPQVASLHTFLRTKYPEIESVVINTQEWSTRNLEAFRVIPQVSATASWVAGTSAWCYNNGNVTPDTAKPDNGAIYGKLYNKAARDVILTQGPVGWHVATEAELTAIAALGGNALKFAGTDYWTTAGGTNATGFTALGGGSRNADGSFNDVKNTASFWCADSDKVLKVYHDSNIAEIIAADPKEGHSIRLIKN